MNEIIKFVELYYPKQFAEELGMYCQGRSDADLGYTLPNKFPSPHRRIRIGTSGWEPREYKNDFFICLYFITLTDQALHSHFPQEHRSFDSRTNFPKMFTMSYMISPIGILSYLYLNSENKKHVIEKWEKYSVYFIQIEWIKNLPQICGVRGKDLMKAIINDFEFNRFPVKEYGFGDYRFLEKHLNEIIEDEVSVFD